MSLFDRGPHTVAVQNKIANGRDQYGQTIMVNDGDAITVHGSMQPLSLTEANEIGLTLTNVYRFICRSWPGRPVCDVVWVDHDLPFVPVGDSLRRSTGRNTKHDTVTLQALGSETPRNG